MDNMPAIDVSSLDSELRIVSRDALCRQVVLSCVHHLTEGSRQQIAAEGLVLPQLPGSAHRPPSNLSEIATAIYAHYQVVSACQDCHYSGKNNSPDETQDNGPTSAPKWASNVNYTIYAGYGDCCSEKSPWVQTRVIDRRFDLDPPQQLETTTFCDDGAHNGTCCILGQCRNKPDQWTLRQYGDCVIFYNGTTIWEWYTSIGKCTKLVDGAGEVTNTWFLDSNAGKYETTDELNDVPDFTISAGGSSAGRLSRSNCVWLLGLSRRQSVQASFWSRGSRRYGQLPRVCPNSRTPGTTNPYQVA